MFGWTILPRANDTAMPHVWDDALPVRASPSDAGSSTPIAVVVLQGAWFTLRIALAGFAIGTLFGLGLAILMARFKVVERGLLPYLVISQTVPLIALAPLVVSWGGKLSIGGFEWPRWLSAAVLGAFLAFFPVAVGTLKGLTSTPTGLAGAHGLLRGLVAPDAVQAAIPGRGAVHDPGAQAGGDGLGDRCGRRRALDRPGRRGRTPDHRVRASRRRAIPRRSTRRFRRRPRSASSWSGWSPWPTLTLMRNRPREA